MSGMEQKPYPASLAWLVLLWSGSVLALAVVAWLLRQAMQAAGFRA
ncbi:hypothetical protein SSTU70S_03021 [Stutzerimonas stutzeri]